MDDLVHFAFQDLVTRFDQLTVVEPRSLNGLLNIYSELRLLYQDFEELLRLVEKVTSLNED